jgi:hypothetical protein
VDGSRTVNVLPPWSSWQISGRAGAKRPETYTIYYSKSRTHRLDTRATLPPEVSHAYILFDTREFEQRSFRRRQCCGGQRRSTPCFFRRDLCAAAERTDPSVSLFYYHRRVAGGAAFASSNPGRRSFCFCVAWFVRRIGARTFATLLLLPARLYGRRRRQLLLRRHTSKPACAL